MNSKTTISISEARKKIFNIAEAVQKPGVYYTLTEKGRPKAVMMSAEEFDSLMEDLELMSDPGFAKRMAAVEKEFARGEYSSWSEVKKKLGWDKLEPALVMEKAKKAYGARPKKK
jgi:prevent-host-death family protein